MKNELESIDNYLRSEIEGMEMTPSEHVWDSIDKKLQSKETAGDPPARINLKLVAGVAALISLAVFVTYNYKSNTPKQSIAPATEIKTEASAKNTEALTIGSGSKSENGAVNENQVHLNKPVSINSKANSTSLTSGKTLNPAQEEGFTGLNDRQEVMQEAYLSAKTISTLSSEKRDNSDKTIILLPYFPSTYKNEQEAQDNKQGATSPSVKTDIAEPAKVENKESVIYMPNAFTPNGDGLNDVFLPQTAENITVKEYKLSIYDRSGKLVFYSEEVLKGWDGRSQDNGAEITKEDVYMWRIEMKNAKGEKEHLMGSITLLR